MTDVVDHEIGALVRQQVTRAIRASYDPADVRELIALTAREAARIAYRHAVRELVEATREARDATACV